MHKIEFIKRVRDEKEGKRVDLDKVPGIEMEKEMSRNRELLREMLNVEEMIMPWIPECWNEKTWKGTRLR